MLRTVRRLPKISPLRARILTLKPFYLPKSTFCTQNPNDPNPQKTETEEKIENEQEEQIKQISNVWFLFQEFSRIRNF